MSVPTKTPLTDVSDGPETVTIELHDALLPSASRALQLMAVVPTGNNEPEAGEHDVVTGGVPPAVTGVKVTGTGLPFDDEARGTGQVIDNGGAGALGVVPTSSFELALLTRALLYD